LITRAVRGADIDAGVALHVVRVLAKLEPGGAQLSVLRLSVALRAHGIETRLVVGDACRAGVRLAREHGFEPECFRSRLSGLQWTPSRAFAAWLAPRLAGAQLVHAHMFGAWWAAARAMPQGVPLVASEHNALQWPGRAPTSALREALRRVDLFFAHGPAARTEILAAGLPAARMREGRSAIAPATAPPIPGLPSPRVVFAGRLHPEKGPDLLLDALAQLRDPPPTYMLGAGAMLAELRSRATRLGIDGTVRFEGWRERPERWIAGASVCVVPSRFDAWSQTAVLAMSLGVPVVGTAVEGLPSVLGGGRGMLVPPDDPAAIARAISGMLSGRIRTDLHTARRYARMFSPRLVAARYASAYRELCGPRDVTRKPAAA
jgi:glycosyltransferase involved in cell wall biosynthesis